MTDKEAMAKELEELAGKFSEGWHEGIKIDASDIMLLSQAAEALAQPEQEPVGEVGWAANVPNTIREVHWKNGSPPIGTKLFIHPPQRTEQEPLIGCVNHDCDKCKLLKDERLELIGHADLAINNIYIFNGYGEDVPEDRTPIYAGYKAAHGIKENT
jgi:hypothetical protein